MICLSSVPLFLKSFVRELPWYRESINDAPHARFQLVGARLLPLRLRESARTRVHPESLSKHCRIVLPADRHQGYSISVYRALPAL
jgi:hypothetical protein